jgi:hypothetical protein
MTSAKDKAKAILGPIGLAAILLGLLAAVSNLNRNVIGRIAR